MEKNGRGYDANDIAEDLKNNIEEIAGDTELTLDETKPEDFKADDWEGLRNAIKEARRTLRELQEQIDRKQIEAEEFDADDARYETSWN